jgi:D-alanyl-D-alanine carboxypeptidase
MIKKKREFGAVFFTIIGLCLLAPFLILNRSNAIEAGQGAAFLASGEDSLFRPIKKPTAVILSLNANNALSILVDFKKSNDKVLYAKNADAPAPIASMSKLMTAIVAMENYDPTDLIVLSRESAEALRGTGISVRAGDKMTVDSLLHIMLIESNNAAAEALAQKLGRVQFIALMNRKATDLGLENTVFYNPNGLDISATITNVATPMDLKKIAVYIIKNQPFIADICSIKQFDVYVDGRLLKHLDNTNILLKSGSDYLWGKTGYTEEANGCIILILKRPFSNISGHSSEYVINIIMGADGKINRFSEAQKMEDWIINSFIW